SSLVRWAGRDASFCAVGPCLAGRRAAGELDEGEAHTADLHAIGAHVGRRPEATACGKRDDVVLIDAVAAHSRTTDERPAPVERYAAGADLDAVGGDGGAVRWQRVARKEVEQERGHEIKLQPVVEDTEVADGHRERAVEGPVDSVREERSAEESASPVAEGDAAVEVEALATRFADELGDVDRVVGR